MTHIHPKLIGTIQGTKCNGWVWGLLVPWVYPEIASFAIRLLSPSIFLCSRRLYQITVGKVSVVPAYNPVLENKKKRMELVSEKTEQAIP